MSRIALSALSLFLVASPAISAPLNKADVDKIATAYMDGFGKKDSKAIAALFTKDGLHVNQSGFRNPAEYYDEGFKAGFDKLDATVDQVHPLTADTGIAMGQFTLTGKNAEGKDLKVSGRWSDVLVNENGVWKIRMLTGFPNPEKK
jgi:ketosteroid isomerase-like protein